VIEGGGGQITDLFVTVEIRDVSDRNVCFELCAFAFRYARYAH